VASVIAGATSPDQIAANVEAGRYAPSPDDLAVLDGLSPTHRPASG
jgi:aryl-alcohol dehydrogenase-like predicted oxidoreductase